MRSMSMGRLAAILLIFELGACDFQSTGDDYERQIEVCSAAERNGLLDTAFEACSAALTIARDSVAEPDLISDLQYRIGRIERQRGRFQEAEALVRGSLAFEEQSGEPGSVAARLVELSLSLAGQGRWSDGAGLLERAAPLVENLKGDERKTAANVFRGFSVQLGRKGYSVQAERFKTRATELANSY